MTMNVMFPEPCAMCQSVDICRDDCGCPVCRVPQYGNRDDIIRMWIALHPVMTALDAAEVSWRWSIDTSGQAQISDVYAVRENMILEVSVWNKEFIVTGWEQVRSARGDLPAEYVQVELWKGSDFNECADYLASLAGSGY